MKAFRQGRSACLDAGAARAIPPATRSHSHKLCLCGCNADVTFAALDTRAFLVVSKYHGTSCCYTLLTSVSSPRQSAAGGTHTIWAVGVQPCHPFSPVPV